MIVSQHLRSLLLSMPVKLRVFKPIALELLQLLVDPDVRFFDVVRIIKSDQTLAAHVFKMANSPAYIGKTSCDTMEAAAIRLGTQQIANIAIAASHASLHVSENRVVHDIMQDLWFHSHACALGSRMVAIKSGHAEYANHAYMAGLLHDIGKLYLLKTLEQINRNMVSDDILQRDLLLAIFSEMHVAMGCRVMDALNIPPIYHDVTTRHHEEQTEADDILLSIVRLVNINSRTFRLSPFPMQPPSDKPVSQLGLVCLDESAMAKLEAAMTDSISGISA